jgi:FkbM family methyltransferase
LKAIKIDLEGFASFTVVPTNENEAQFWKSLMSGSWEPDTVEAIRYLAHPGRVFWDVGAWIGPTVLLALARGADVVAFEPDPVALRSLFKNLEANPGLRAKATVVEAALAEANGQQALRTQTELGDSMSSLTGRGTKGPSIETLSFLGALSAHSLPAGSVVKIDIEGGEFLLGRKVWLALKERNVTLILSTHPTILGAWYRVSERKKLNRLFAIGRSFRPTADILRSLFPMTFFGDYTTRTGWLPLRLSAVLYRLFGGKNQVFVVSTSDWRRTPGLQLRSRE